MTYAYSTNPSSRFAQSPTRKASPTVSPMEQTGSCACGGSCPRCHGGPSVQTKVAVGGANDAYEREADRISERLGDASTSTPAITSRRETPSDAQVPAPDGLETATPTDGEPLAAPTRNFMESRLGADLSSVRVHGDAQAAAMNASLDARAFTYGSHIWLGAGESASDPSLMAHELVHTVQQGRASAPTIQRAPRVANQTWTVDHSDVEGHDEIVHIGVAVDYLGMSSEISQLYGYIVAERPQWATKKGLYVRALDFLRDNRDRFDVPDVHEMVRRALDYCDASSANPTRLTDSFYEQLLLAAVYSPGVAPATFRHRTFPTSVYEIPGRSSAATDFVPAPENSLFRQDLSPDTAITGGFSSTTDLRVAYGAQGGSVSADSVRLMLDAHGRRVPSQLRPYLEVLATDATIFSVLQRFLQDDNGRFRMQAVSYGGAHYTHGRPPSIEVDDDIFPGSGTSRESTEIGVRATLAHELYHYALDRADAALALNELGGESDHRLISIVQDRYVITEMLRAGQAPISDGIECLHGYVGGDPKPSLRTSISSDDRAELRRFVGTQDFLESVVYTSSVTLIGGERLRRASEMGHTPAEYMFDPSQITELTYLAAINAVILRKAFQLAADFADRTNTPLSNVWANADYQREIRVLISQLVALASRDRRRGVLELEAML